MHLSEINIFPIKSLKGISLEKALVEDRGLQFDRRWMLIDEKNQFLTQREFPQLATIQVKIYDKSLIVSAKDNTLKVPFGATVDKTASAKVWSSSVKSKVYNDEINQWFSDILELNCKLVVMPEEAQRKVEPFYAVRKYVDTVSFADAYPFLLIGESSLNDLNERLEKSVPMNRFRPNLVISDSDAFAEDTWNKIKIGETVFHVVKPCARCVMTTVEQSTGERSGKEPLKTLAKYRTKNSKVLFGQNLIAEKPGKFIQVGDKVEIIKFNKV